MKNTKHDQALSVAMLYQPKIGTVFLIIEDLRTENEFFYKEINANL